MREKLHEIFMTPENMTESTLFQNSYACAYMGLADFNIKHINVNNFFKVLKIFFYASKKKFFLVSWIMSCGANKSFMNFSGCEFKWLKGSEFDVYWTVKKRTKRKKWVVNCWKIYGVESHKFYMFIGIPNKMCCGIKDE